MSQNTVQKHRQKLSLAQYSYVIIFIVLFIAYYLISGQLKWTGITNILRHSAVVGVISLGMGLITCPSARSSAVSRRSAA